MKGGVWAHGTSEDDVPGEPESDGRATIGDVSCEIDTTVSPGAEQVNHFARELGLLAVRIACGLTILGAAVEPEEDGQGPGTRREGNPHDDRQDDPAMAEGKDLASLGGADGIEVAAYTEHVRALLGCEGVIDHGREGAVQGHEVLDAVEQQPAEGVRVPCAAGEEAMKGLVVADAGDARHDKSLCHRVSARGEDPTDKDDECFVEAGPSESWSEDLQS
jgi:hypothetical protein